MPNSASIVKHYNSNQELITIKGEFTDCLNFFKITESGFGGRTHLVSILKLIELLYTSGIVDDVLYGDFEVCVDRWVTKEEMECDWYDVFDYVNNENLKLDDYQKLLAAVKTQTVEELGLPF